jgi:hypothetical protein
VNAEKETLNRDMARLKQMVDSLGNHVKPQMVKDVDCLFKVSPRCYVFCASIGRTIQVCTFLSEPTVTCHNPLLC